MQIKNNAHTQIQQSRPTFNLNCGYVTIE